VSGHRHLLLVLALLQAALGLLAALGQLLFVAGNPAYLAVPVIRAALLVTAAAVGRRWGMVAIVVLEGLSVTGFWVSAAVGLLPWVDTTVNPVGLLANVVLPGAMTYLAARILAAAPARPAPPLPPAVVPAVPAASAVPARPAPTLFLPTEFLS
jgi:hypothetical protein